MVAGTYPVEPATLAVAEALLSTLLEGGLSEREAAWTCWSIVHLAIGLTQEEQVLPGREQDLDVGERPALRRVLPHLASASFDDRFEYDVHRPLGLRRTDARGRAVTRPICKVRIVQTNIKKLVDNNAK